MKTFKPYILLLPSMILVALLLFSLLDSILQSLGHFLAGGLNSFTLDYYREVLGTMALKHSIFYSLYLSLISSIFSVVLGVALCYILISIGKSDTLFYKIPIAIPHLVVAFLIISVFSQTGIFARIAFILGLIDEPHNFPLLVQDPYGIGIILAYIIKQFPYVMSIVILIMNRVSNSYDEVARTLGGNKFNTFFHTTLPLCAPSISSAFIIIFAFSFGAYELPFLLGSTLPRALPVEAYIAFTNPNLAHRPYAMVYCCIMIIGGIIFTLLYYISFKKLISNNKVVK